MKRSKDVYQYAGEVIESACNRRGSLKQLCYSNACRQKKKLFALVHQTLKHKQLLEKLLTHTNNIWGDYVVYIAVLNFKLNERYLVP